MNVILKLAIKNIARHTTRNFIIGFSIAISVGLFFFVLSFATGIEKQLINNLIQIETGAISFIPDREVLKGETFIDSEKMSAFYAQLEDINGVAAIRERVHTRAMIHATEKSVDINLRGVNWEKEKALLASLRFEHPPSFENLDEPTGIFISQTIADKLDVKKEDYCSILTQTVHGSLNLGDFYVKGIYKNISSWANTMVFIDLNSVKNLINSPISTNILVDCDDLDNTATVFPKVATLLETELKDSMEVASYHKQASMASTIANANRYGFLSIVIFLQIISFFGIAFVVNNNIMERNKEIGTLLAMGFTPKQVRWTFILESVTIGFIASFIGLVIFGGLTFFFSQKGLFLGELAAIVFGNSVLKPFISGSYLLIALMVGILYTFVSSLWSTFKIKKVDPINLLYDR